MSPEWEIFFRKSMELSYGVPEGVNGTRKNLSPVAWTACSYLRRLRFELLGVVARLTNRDLGLHRIRVPGDAALSELE